MTDYLGLSVNRILEAQTEYGSFVAAPTFQTYAFCWFRDSAFIAHALNLAGEFDAAEHFHNWASSVVLANESLIEESIRLRPADAVSQGLYMKARYRLDGLPDDEESAGDSWPNFQLDGLGTWVWSLERFVDASKRSLSDEHRKAVGLVARYLDHFWDTPCYDYWEEKPESQHASTLLSIAAGLACARELIGIEFDQTGSRLNSFLEAELVSSGVLQKCTGLVGLDASTLALIEPFGTSVQIGVSKDEQWRQINEKLNLNGGLVRYLGDTYYGGGEWILLTAWSAWAAKSLGRQADFSRLIAWVESQFDSAGNLPEQSLAYVQDKSYVAEWIARWGEPANPLTWSYAMYVIALLAKP